ncbi:MAG: FGGY-family carbohydrate kinase, partial [Anaerolineae bacterium]
GALLHVLRAIATHAAGADRRIVALALAAQSGSLLPAGREGTPIYPIITWLDGRTEALVQRWRAEGLEARVRAVGGWHLYPGLPLPTVAWLRAHRPDVFAAAGRYLSVNDYLVHRLTGEFCTNPSNGGGMQFLDVTTGAWSAELCALAGIAPGHLSPVRPAGAAIGPVTPAVSRLTGLPADTVVVNGGHDQGCAALGLGVIEPGEVLLGCGTAWVVTGVTAAPDVAALPPSLDLNFHPAPRRWTISQSLGGLGASLAWLVGQCWPATGHAPAAGEEPASSRAAAFATLDAALADTTPGSDGLTFLPMAGGHEAPAGEQRGALVGLRLDHTRADMARAVMEGAAYELRWALAPVRGAGLPIERLILVGGAAQSPLWPQAVADVTGVPLSLPQGSHWPAVGAAILAGVGVGAFDTIAVAQARFQRPARQVAPDPERMQIYDRCFAAYQQLTVAQLSET